MHKSPFLAAAVAATAICASVSSAVSTAAYAKGPFTYCPHIFGTNGQPRVVATAATGRTQSLCFRGYAVQTSAATRKALWSAENLTAQVVLAARSVPRDSDFYEEAEIPAPDRARLSDYGRGSGLDRGRPHRATYLIWPHRPRASVSPTSCRRPRPAIDGCGAISKPRPGGWRASTARSSW